MARDWPERPVLRLHRAERADTLAASLADVLRAPLDDVFAVEVVAVPAKGVERWLGQRLSAVLGARPGDDDGVAAGIVFPSPTRLVDDVLAGAGGWSADSDPWQPGRVVWELLRVIDESIDQPWCVALSAHLGGAGTQAPPHRAGRRYASAEHLARLLRSYAAHRPQMLLDWWAGGQGDGAGGALAPDQQWQAELWRHLRRAVDVPSPAERLAGACALLREDPGCSSLPERLSVFGATRLTTEQLSVLHALAVHRQVHLWLPHPSPAMWQRLSTSPAAHRRRDDDSALRVQHPLLASLARDARELQQVLVVGGPVEDTLHESPQPTLSLLRCVQQALAQDEMPTSLAPPDGSVQVHSCHGPVRQVEVLREALLHLFQDDPTLEPRDVLVMCPDVEAYAPLIRAAFGQSGSDHPGHELRVRLADRSLRQTNPLLSVLAALLELADGRVSASQVLDLAATDPVRRHFCFTDADLERLQDWAARTGVRWGLGPRQRARYALDGLPQNTWQTGLDRLLLGVAADETTRGWLGLALPVDDVDSSDIDLVGRLAELVARLQRVLDTLEGPQDAKIWTDRLLEALDSLTEVGAADQWQRVQAGTELAAATRHGAGTTLGLPEVRALLAGQLAGRPTRANFRTGELTVCTMVPMRSVPHRVVALLGLDDGAFPRSGSTDGDDILQRSPCLGERDPRSEDRQLLLDAVMSASQALLLLHTGADPVSGVDRPPAVPLGELLDTLRATTGDPGLAGVLIRHPLQPFDRRNFLLPEPFSFDRAGLAGAQAADLPRRPVPALLTGPLPPTGRDDVDLDDLVALLVHPTRVLLTRRLGLILPEAAETVSDALSAELDPLQTWEVGERLLAARLAGEGAAAFRQAEWRRGTLPPGPLGMRVMADLEEKVEVLVTACGPLHAGRAERLDVDVDLGDGRRLTGSVSGVHPPTSQDAGSVLVRTSYSRLAPKHRLPAWVRLLALSATGHRVSAVTSGRGPGRRPVQRSTLLAPPDPAEVLRTLVSVHDQGMREVLPVATGATATYAQARRRGEDPEAALEAAGREFSSRFGDGLDRHLAYVHGRPPPFAALTAEPGRTAGEPTRFGALACTLWGGLLEHESLGAP